jgi:hypothetical protein
VARPVRCDSTGGAFLYIPILQHPRYIVKVK